MSSACNPLSVIRYPLSSDGNNSVCVRDIHSILIRILRERCWPRKSLKMYSHDTSHLRDSWDASDHIDLRGLKTWKRRCWKPWYIQFKKDAVKRVSNYWTGDNESAFWLCEESVGGSSSFERKWEGGSSKVLKRWGESVSTVNRRFESTSVKANVCGEVRSLSIRPWTGARGPLGWLVLSSRWSVLVSSPSSMVLRITRYNHVTRESELQTMIEIASYHESLSKLLTWKRNLVPRDIRSYQRMGRSQLHWNNHVQHLPTL